MELDHVGFLMDVLLDLSPGVELWLSTVFGWTTSTEAVDHFAQQLSSLHRQDMRLLDPENVTISIQFEFLE